MKDKHNVYQTAKHMVKASRGSIIGHGRKAEVTKKSRNLPSKQCFRRPKWRQTAVLPNKRVQGKNGDLLCNQQADLFSPRLLRDLTWHVGKNYTFSDHQATISEIWRKTPCNETAYPKPRRISRWITKALDQ